MLLTDGPRHKEPLNLLCVLQTLPEPPPTEYLIQISSLTFLEYPFFYFTSMCSCSIFYLSQQQFYISGYFSPKCGVLWTFFKPCTPCEFCLQTLLMILLPLWVLLFPTLLPEWWWYLLADLSAALLLTVEQHSSGFFLRHGLPLFCTEPPVVSMPFYEVGCNLHHPIPFYASFACADLSLAASPAFLHRLSSFRPLTLLFLLSGDLSTCNLYGSEPHFSRSLLIREIFPDYAKQKRTHSCTSPHMHTHTVTLLPLLCVVFSLGSYHKWSKYDFPCLLFVLCL